MKTLPTFETYNVDLAAFLMLQGLKFIECKLDSTSDLRPRAIMCFFDEKHVARDLERVFMSHEISRFSSYKKYLLKDIHRTIKGV